MSYGFKPDDLPKQSLPFPIGACVANVQLESCTYAADGSWEAIDFQWTRTTDDGVQTLRDRRFAVNESTIRVGNSETTQDAIDRAYANFNGILNHIGRKFVSVEQLGAVAGEGFRGFAEAYCTLINEFCKGTDVYLKTLPNNNGYAQAGKYPTFCQLMSDGDCTLAYSKKELELIAAQTKSTAGVSESHTPYV